MNKAERNNEERLFIGVFPCGLVYADRYVEKDGDYKHLAFLPYATLDLEWRAKRIEPELKKRIETDAAEMKAKRGQEFYIAVNASVTLGKR